MPPVSIFNSVRSLRIIVALFLSFALFFFLYTGWSPVSREITSEVVSRPRPAETTTGSTRPDSNPPSEPSPPTSSSQPPAETSSYSVPEKVWHSAPNDNITEHQHEWISSWTRTSPSLRQELLTDRSSEAFVRAHFSQTRPDIVEVYEELSIPILRADFLRYLIILAEGGIWSDLDVTCEKQISEWVPPEYKARVDMVVGLEFDFEWRGPGTQVASQFCNWVFMARPSSHNLQAVIDAVVNKIKDIAHSNGVPIADVTLDMLPVDVVDVTGPKIMTISILDRLSRILGRPVDDRDFSGIKRPKLIGDVLIMPGNSFAATQNAYPTDQGDALVTHHYEGSWKQADAEAKERKKQKDQAQAQTGGEEVEILK